MLSDKVLVLNNGWSAICAVSVRSAICLLYRERGLVIDLDDFSTYSLVEWFKRPVDDSKKIIRSVNFTFEQPEVILLKHYQGHPNTKIAFNSQNLWIRDNGRCQYCLNKIRLQDLTVDHVQPRSRGGATSWSNCVAACMKCNNKKGNRTPGEAGMHLKIEPRRPTWNVSDTFTGKISEIFGNKS